MGGVDTLFKDSADTVMEYAANAYKTAGLSANEYMETVTSFSASLLQSLGGDTEQAAQMADLAITDMSDNVNKMGSSMESVQNAYQGFAKQNYTMLDNLKLGYGGTKEEMERLLADAEKLSGIKYDVSSYADIVSAIHVVQTEMGIIGTTALEASTTIQGSIGSMKAAWENLVTGLADENADMDALINNFVDSAVTVGENMIPVVEAALSSIGDLIAKLAPTIGAEIPAIITEVLPSLLEAGVQLIQGIVEGVMSALPQLLEAGKNAVSELVSSFAEGLPEVLEKGSEIIDSLVKGILNAIPNLLEALPQVIDGIVSFITKNLPAIIQTGVNILLNLKDGIIDTIPKLVEKIPEIIKKIVSTLGENLPKIIKAGFDILIKLTEGILSGIPKMISSLPKVVKAILTGLGEAAKGVLEIGKNVVKGLWDGIVSMAGHNSGYHNFFDGICFAEEIQKFALIFRQFVFARIHPAFPGCV